MIYDILLHVCHGSYAVEDAVKLNCVLWPGHDGPHWHRPIGIDIRDDPGIHWFVMPDVPMEPAP